MIYIGSIDGKLYCIDGEIGSLIWSLSIGSRIYSSPAISGDGSTVYVGGYDGKLYAVNTNTGLESWSYSTGGAIYGAAAVDTNGVIYIGSSDGKLYAVNSNGTLKWLYTADAAIFYSSPAIGNDGNVYVGSDDKKLHAIRMSNGIGQWTYSTQGVIRNSPVVTGNGIIFFASADGYVYTVTDQGNLNWSRDLGGQIQISSLAIGPNGNLYVGSYNNYFYAIGLVDTVAPAAPQNLTASAGHEVVQLNWTANTENDVLRYRIFRNTSLPAAIKIDSVAVGTTSYTDQAVINGTTYYYRLTAIDQVLNESDFSVEVNITPRDTTPPTVPQNLVAQPGKDQVTLTWDSFSLADFLRYRIYGGTSANPTSVVDSTSIITDTTVTFTGLTNGTTYYYRLTAVDSALNESDYSNEVNVTPYAGPVWHVAVSGNNRSEERRVGKECRSRWSPEH